MLYKILGNEFCPEPDMWLEQRADYKLKACPTTIQHVDNPPILLTVRYT